MTAAEALRLAVPRLAAAGVEDPARDARVLLAHALDFVGSQTRTWRRMAGQVVAIW